MHSSGIGDYGGYCQALVHLAWFREDKIRHLLFGMVELRPNEFPNAVGCPTKSLRVGNKGRRYLHYRRLVLSAADAIGWYQAAARGHPVLPSDPSHSTRGDGERFEGGSFAQEPPWPHLATSKELVFTPDWMQGSRTHFLFPKHALPSRIDKLINTDRNRATLEEWLNFDLVDDYREYQGAICLVVPNPVFRSIERTHVEDSAAEASDIVAYKLVARQGQRVEGLRLEIANERPGGGRLTPLVHEFCEEAIAVLEFPVEVRREGLSITHPSHGLLEWHEPLPLVRSMRFSGRVLSRQKEVVVRPRGRKRAAYKYEVDEFVDAGEVVFGEELNNLHVLSRFAEAESKRNRRQAAIDYDQRWFHCAPSEARAYVHKIIGRAGHTVLIVDPYFAGPELLGFGHAITMNNIALRILTSAQALKPANRDNAKADLGLQLLQIRNYTFSTYATKPRIRVLAGDPSGVHDRFLVVDGNVWLLGNSLHTIGERAGMIIRLPDPEPVIAHLEDFWHMAQILAD